MYTYIIESQGLYKIGKARDVAKRLKSYKTHNPVFQLIKTISGDYEDQLHRAFYKKRSHLEWFKLTEEDVTDIENYIDRDMSKEEASIRLGKIGALLETDPYNLIIKSASKRNKALDLSASALRMFIYITYTLAPESDVIELNPSIYEEIVEKGSESTYKRAIEELLKYEYVSKTNTNYTYRVNQQYIKANTRIK